MGIRWDVLDKIWGISGFIFNPKAIRIKSLSPIYVQYFPEIFSIFRHESRSFLSHIKHGNGKKKSDLLRWFSQFIAHIHPFSSRISQPDYWRLTDLTKHLMGMDRLIWREFIFMGYWWIFYGINFGFFGILWDWKFDAYFNHRIWISWTFMGFWDTTNI